MTDIHLLVGVQNDGLVTSVSILENNNTYGLGMKASSDWDFLVQLVNSKGDLAVGDTSTPLPARPSPRTPSSTP